MNQLFHNLSCPTPSPSSPRVQGTGVLVIDRINGVAYVALSERADRGLAEVRGAAEARCSAAAGWLRHLAAGGSQAAALQDCVNLMGRLGSNPAGRS